MLEEKGKNTWSAIGRHWGKHARNIVNEEYIRDKGVLVEHRVGRTSRYDLSCLTLLYPNLGVNKISAGNTI